MDMFHNFWNMRKISDNYYCHSSFGLELNFVNLKLTKNEQGLNYFGVSFEYSWSDFLHLLVLEYIWGAPSCL